MHLISGWRKCDGSLMENIQAQSQQTQLMLEQKLYEVVGRLAEFGLEGDRYDRRKKVGTTRSSDIWSLGCLLYEIMTNDFLFYNNSNQSILEKVTERSFRWP